jgi:hypothetical protein
MMFIPPYKSVRWPRCTDNSKRSNLRHDNTAITIYQLPVLSGRSRRRIESVKGYELLRNKVSYGL